jgi:arylsulfatase A-like enzyme
MACGALAAAASAELAARPNLVVFLADDLAFSDVGAGGEIPTPRIDRLAAEGVRFTQFYNAARCSPTRASLLTGRTPHSVGIGHLNARDLIRATSTARRRLWPSCCARPGTRRTWPASGM